MSSSFLHLPQELRDLIFEYALSEDDRVTEHHPATCDYQMKPLPVANNDRWDWNGHYAPQAVSIAYLSLMLCNRQLYKEIHQFLSRAQKHDCLPAKLTLVMSYPSLVPTWTRIPAPPHQISDLEILFKVDQMYHPAYISRGARNALVAAVFEILKRFIHRGPHLARLSPLPHPLSVNTVRITLAPPVPFSDMTHIYGFPEQQLQTLFNEFKALMLRFGRSGIPYGNIGAFEVRMEGKEWSRFPATSNIWDEEDFTYFQFAGYKWDEGDFRTDQIPW